MSTHHTVHAALAEGEDLLWQGAPMPGRPFAPRTFLKAAVLIGLALGLLFLASVIELYRGHFAVWHYVVLGVVTLAAFFTFFAIKITFLDRRRARAQDASTAYAITDRRALALAGPYATEVRLSPAVSGTISNDGLDISGDNSSVRFDRLEDASAVLDILNKAVSATR